MTPQSSYLPSSAMVPQTGQISIFGDQCGVASGLDCQPHASAINFNVAPAAYPIFAGILYRLGSGSKVMRPLRDSWTLPDENYGSHIVTPSGAVCTSNYGYRIRPAFCVCSAQRRQWSLWNERPTAVTSFHAPLNPVTNNYQFGMFYSNSGHYDRWQPDLVWFKDSN